jgi:membrane protease YdiL (CAAX protease family)
MAVINGTVIVVLFATIFIQAVQSKDWRSYLGDLVGNEQPQAAALPPGTPPGTGGPVDPIAGEGSPAPPPKDVKTGDVGKPAPAAVKLSAEFGRLLQPAMLLGEVVSVLFGLVIVRLFVGKNWRRALALCRPSLTQTVIAVLGLPGLILVATAVHALARQVLPGGNYGQDLAAMFETWPLWFGVLVVGIGPGIGEELWCRGFLGRGLVGRYGAFVGILLTSLFFGLMHVDPPHVVGTMVMGMALHYVYLMTRSLWVPMLLHACNNSLAVVATKIKALESADPAPERVPYYIYGMAVLLLAAVGYALYRSRPRLVDADGSGPGPWQPDFPGVEHPPAGSGTVVHRPWPGWLASALLVLAVAGFGTSIYLAIPSEKSGGETPAAVIGSAGAAVRPAQPL